MRTKPGFTLRQICGENIIIAEGEENIDFGNIISMNDSASYLWQQLQGRDFFDVADMIELMQKEYDVDTETAFADCKQLAAVLAKAGIIEGDDVPKLTDEPAAPAKKLPPIEQPRPQASQKSIGKNFIARLFGRGKR